MSRTPGTTRSAAARRPLRSLALIVAAAAVATTAATGLGLGPSLASADPETPVTINPGTDPTPGYVDGDAGPDASPAQDDRAKDDSGQQDPTQVDPAPADPSAEQAPDRADPGDTAEPLGSSRLVQSEDLAAIQVKLDKLTVVLDQDEDFSSCLGEGNRWTEVLSGSPKPVTAVWQSQRNEGQALSQTIARAKTPAQAKRFAKTLVQDGIKDCQQGKDQKWDFYYGKTDSSGIGSGFATWAVSYTGDNKLPDGGIAVFHKGTTFGIIQVSGTWGPADQMMESVAKVAVSRLD